MGPLLDQFCSLWGEGSAKEVWEPLPCRMLEKDVKEVGQVGIGYGIVVRRISHHRVERGIGKRQVSRRRPLDRAEGPDWRIADNALRHPFHRINPVAAGL